MINMSKTIINSINNIINFCARKAMSWIFRFHSWNAIPLSSKRYAQDIIRYLSGTDNDKRYLEIGCGLGDIIRNVHFKSRLGLDREAEVLRAARFLSNLSRQNNITFKQFTFPQDSIHERFNIIVMVNWIHHIDPDTLRSKINKYYSDNLENTGSIIIDTVLNEKYKHNHNINFLTSDINSKNLLLGRYENGREIWIINKA